MAEAHNTKYSIHPRGTKMYIDLRQIFWWNNMKKDTAKYASKCLSSQKVKAKHQRLIGELRPLELPTWKRDSISIDFVMGLPGTTSKNNIWVIVDRLTKTTYFIVHSDA